ncbi:MAG: hypothetical protein WDN45_12095 [Caulobacteraceae bacterium]
MVKNKVAPPFREVEFDIMYGRASSKLGEIIDLGVKAGVVEKSGSWFSLLEPAHSVRAATTPANSSRPTPDMAAEIEAAVRKNAVAIVRGNCWSAPLPRMMPSALKQRSGSA